ncbi:Mitochondrial dicarboxylate carrier [Acipenser ruthenus]|uniref:Mitochondrial dicarboxylate carrier n=1 Tax=Acipenser ruthenus TaxID=7906 RepID=A0A444U0D9_ACIRT|nr:Mitochondrial dicarboxylate carrier [Acipenser ruthenus]
MTEKKVSRWYFGGLASCGAACCTHPLDLIKVHLQTQQEVKSRMTGMVIQVVRSDGVLALYSGLSASLCRQMTYSLTRFAIYETVRDRISSGSQAPLPFYQKVLLGAFGGFTGGLVGTPADLVNVRMQNDVKLPAHLRRNYAHALDGLYRVWHEAQCLQSQSLQTSFVRARIVRLAHLMAPRLSRWLSATELAARLGWHCERQVETVGVMHCLIETAKLGPMAFYKGLVPAGIRLVPHTVLTFIFLEQLRKNFGMKVIA